MRSPESASRLLGLLLLPPTTCHPPLASVPATRVPPQDRALLQDRTETFALFLGQRQQRRKSTARPLIRNATGGLSSGSASRGRLASTKPWEGVRSVLVGEKLSLMNWKFVGRRRGVELPRCESVAGAALLLLDAYEAAGAPKERGLEALTGVERHMHEVQADVQVVARGIEERLVWDGVARAPRVAEEAAEEAAVRRRLDMNESLKAALPWNADDAVNGRRGGRWRQEFLDSAAKEAREAGVPDMRGIGYPSPTAVK